MLSVRGSDQLQAVVLALKVARREVRNDIARATRAEVGPLWVDAVTRRAATPLDRAVLVKGARLVPGNPPALAAAQSRRRLRGGLVPIEQWRPLEFGADPKRTTYQRTARGGATHQVTRTTTAQLPARRLKGRVVYPAVKAVAPRITALWVQLVVRKFAEAAEAGER